MEKTDLIMENKIEVEEESSILSRICISPKNYTWINQEVLVVILKVDRDGFSNQLSDFNVCGKKMIDWVLMATNGPLQKIIEEKDSLNVLEIIKQNLENKKYVFLTYSDIPLLQKSTFYEIMDYFSMKGLNSLELPRGYVFRSDYLINLTEIQSSIKKSFGTYAFDRVNDSKSLMRTINYLENKIKNYHKNNGIVLLGEETIFIDADVEIEENTIIYPNNILKGNTYIGKNVILESGNIIKDSIISSDCSVESSYLDKSKITEGKKIGPCAKIIRECV